MKYVLCIALVLCSLLLIPVGAVPAADEGDAGAYQTMDLRSAEKSAVPPPDAVVKTLYAGRTIPVGTVSLWTEDGTMMVAYATTGGWVLKEVHLHVDCVEAGDVPGGADEKPSKKGGGRYGHGWEKNAGSAGNSGYPVPDQDDVPQNRNGNPIVGHFEHKVYYPDGGTTTSGTIDMGPVGTCDAMYVAAHAKVARGGESIPLPPPGVVTYLPVRNKGDAPVTFSLFAATITGGGLDGVYPAWCIDYDTAIRSGTGYTARFYPAYGPDVPGPLRDYEASDLSWEEVLNCIAYLINHKDGSYTFSLDDPFFPGETVSWSESGNWKELQGAMWWVIKPSLVPENMTGMSSGGQIKWDNRITYAILSSARADGCTSFMPGCGDLAAVIVDPYSSDAPDTPRQLMVIEVPVPCGPYEEESAWGAMGDPLTYPFPWKNWATYIVYTVNGNAD
ncbi:hypothetical protein [Methanofollis sp. UBA420]|jgi:hypothetical protein|uniref:hypothetical protein n=1 Tax=Methanofollis sp. UBA420 TaxID=1915514 RepID=UPI00316AD3AD